MLTQIRRIASDDTTRAVESPDNLDAVWEALSDPTRRAILDLLRDGPRTTTEIVESFSNMTRLA